MITVHIAGTNGKGSVAEYISNILNAAGMKCGLFTSPHLISPTERLRINGKRINAAVLDALMAEVKQRSLAKNDTLFAAYTATASLWFDREQVDAAVYETGLGGRLDPTNSVLPDAVVLTPIDIDHTNVLGSSIEQIAAEKCGIIKCCVPVISAPQHPVVASIIQEHCKRCRAPLTFAIDTHIVSASLKGQTFTYRSNEYTILSIGASQPVNAAVAAACAITLGIDARFIADGLYHTQLRSRTQYIVGNPALLIDGAHNAASAKALAKTLDKIFARKAKVLLFACMKDKQIDVMAKALAGRFDFAVLTQADEDRGADVATLQTYFSPHTKCIPEQDSSVAYKSALALAKSMNALLVVCGSFYLTGRILSNLSGEKTK